MAAVAQVSADSVPAREVVPMVERTAQAGNRIRRRAREPAPTGNNPVLAAGRTALQLLAPQDRTPTRRPVDSVRAQQALERGRALPHKRRRRRRRVIRRRVYLDVPSASVDRRVPAGERRVPVVVTAVQVDSAALLRAVGTSRSPTAPTAWASERSAAVSVARWRAATPCGPVRASPPVPLQLRGRARRAAG